MTDGNHNNNSNENLGSNCPEPSELLALLEKETDDASLKRHFSQCPRCREIAAKLEAETSALTFLFDSLPAGPDFCNKVGERIAKIQDETAHLTTALHCALLVSVSFALFLAQTLLGHVLPAGLPTVSAVRAISFLTSMIVSIWDLIHFTITRFLPGEPFWPALIVALLPILITLWQKRRYSHE